MIQKIALSENKFDAHRLFRNNLFLTIEPDTSTYLHPQNLIEPKQPQPQKEDDLMNLWNEVEKSYQHQQPITYLDDQLIKRIFQHSPINQLSPKQSNSKTQQNENDQIGIKDVQLSSASDNQEDLMELWNQIQINQQHNHQYYQQPHQQNKNLPQQSHKSNLKQSKQSNSYHTWKVVQKNTTKGINLLYSIDYHVVHKSIFVASQFKPNSYSYFGLKINHHASQNHYVLYSFQNNQQILHCSKFNDQQQSFLFTLAQSDQVIGKMTLIKSKNNSIQLKLYQIKLFDKYENKYIGTQAYVQISDAFIDHYCYCNTVISLIPNDLKKTLKDKEYTQNYLKAQIKQYKMKINKKNGKLTSYMHIQNIFSSPFNCCLEDQKFNSIFMLGLIDQKEKKFVVKIGGPGSLLIGMATAVSRISYIDSFRQ